MIILKLLLNYFKHNSWYFLLLVIFTTFAFCKSKKTIQETKVNQASDSKKTLSAQEEIQFGDLFINACGERMKGNFKESKRLFEECLKIDPSNTATYYELTIIYKMLGSPKEALNNAKLCAASNQKNEWYQILLAECLDEARQYQQAVKVRENLVKNFPANNAFKEELAIEYSVLGQYNNALKIYNELEFRLGVSEQITLNKFRILKNRNDLIGAEKELLKLLETDQSQIRFYNYLAEFYIETKDLEKAKGIYDKIVQIDPTNPNVYLALHDYHLSKGNETAAYEDLIKAIENPQLDLQSKAQVIEDYYRRAEKGNQQSFDQGLNLALLATKKHPNTTAFNALCGDFYKLDRKLKEASIYYYKAAFAEKNNYKVWQNLLITDNELNMFDSLANHSNTAIELFPNQPVFYLYNGLANTSLKKFKTAVTSLTNGLELVYGNKRLMIDFLSAQGDNYNQLKDYTNADKSFEEALKLDSDNTYVLNNYAYYLSERKSNLELAEKLSRRANELKTNNANYMDTYAWIFFQQKKYSQALEWIELSVKLAPTTTVLEHYGDVLFQLNRIEEAVIFWNKSKDKGNKSEILMRKIKDKKWYE